MIRVLIADDHPIVRSGLVGVLAAREDMTVVGEAGTAAALRAAVPTKRPDVVVLDLGMPGAKGFDLIGDLTRAHHRPRILVLTMHPEADFAVRALRAGAAGYLTKDRAPEDLVAAIRRVAGGGTWISTAPGERLALEVRRGTDRPLHEALSDREYQVLRSIGAGQTVGQIAAEMSLSVKTISTYRARILGKMGLRNNAELVQYVVRNGLTD